MIYRTPMPVDRANPMVEPYTVGLGLDLGDATALHLDLTALRAICEVGHTAFSGRNRRQKRKST
ncbi:hypothetical protein OV079_48235 [Nannocystis pusilla]|uniref:Uncharacterized protein n=1 Tax=Nannocystis pusilla TaxID=889268 RepID=A0A9X3J3F4_9BACT|nr:hypothetical protein [Nannocystis pusilla]MCY1013195.1 hypothetical protein [Nannocystis pusilla]